MNLKEKCFETNKSHKIVLNRLKANNFYNINQFNINKPNYRIYKNPYRNVYKTDNCFATMIFIDEKYIPSVLTLGKSLRESGVKNNLICFIQDKSYKKNDVLWTNLFAQSANKDDGSILGGVSEETKRDLFSIYDYIVGIDLLWVEDYQKTKNHFTLNKNYSNIQYYVTKLNIVGFDFYDKIFYLDASTLVKNNLDYIFDNFNQSAFVNDVEYRMSKVGLRGTYFLIKPSIIYYYRCVYLINNYSKYFKDLYLVRGVDEYILFYSLYGDWSKKKLEDDIACNGNSSLDSNQEKCDIVFYQMKKPFRNEDKEDMERMKRFYRNYMLWENFMEKIKEENPSLNKYFKNIKKIDF